MGKEKFKYDLTWVFILRCICDIAFGFILNFKIIGVFIGKHRNEEDLFLS